MMESDLGSYYQHEDGSLWRLATYCSQPTMRLERVDDPAVRVGGAVGAPIFAPFTQLVAASGNSPSA
jgi:hypothetical protein